MTYTPPTSATALGTLTVTQYNTQVKGNIEHLYSMGTATQGSVTATQGSVVAARGNLSFSYLSIPFVNNVTPSATSFAFTTDDNSYYVLLTTSPVSNYIHHLAYTSNGGTSFTFPNGGTAGTGLPQASGFAGYDPGKIASSSNGSVVYFAPNGGGTAGVLLNIYKSIDAGATFSATSSGTTSWKNIVCSSSGSIVYAAGGTYVLYSNNTGTTWSTASPSFPEYSTYQLCCSSSGSIAFFATGDTNSSGTVYKTTDAGASWSTVTPLGSRRWKNIKCSSNGSVVVAAARTGTDNVYSYLYLSTDAGTNWSAITTIGLDQWESATISPDGNYIVARGAHRTFSSKNMGTTFYVEPSIQHDMSFIPQYTSPSGSVVVNLSPNSKVSFI